MSDGKAAEKYRFLMVSIIEKLSQYAGARHREQLATELEWLKSWESKAKDQPAYAGLLEHHKSMYMLFQSIVESVDTTDSAALGAQIAKDFTQAHDFFNALATPDIVKKRMSREPQAGSDSLCSPIFLISSWRSGTTLLMALLGAHKNIVALPETYLLDPFLTAAAGTTRNARPVTLRSRPPIVDACGNAMPLGVTDERFYECFATFIDSVFSGYVRERGGRRWIYKELLNSDSLALIDILFGYRARFIWLVRHGLDVVNSAIERYERRGVQCADLSEYAIEWAQKNEWFADFYDRTPDRCVKLRYEDLLESPSSQARRLLDFLAEPWDEELFTRMQSSTEAIGGDHKFTSSQGKIDSSRTGRWKEWPRAYIEQMSRIVNPMLRRAGYEPL